MAKLKIGTYKASTPSNDYIGYYPCFQSNTSTSVTDLSGNGNDLLFNQSRSSLSVAEAWSSPNKLNTLYAGASSSSKGVFLPTSVINSVDFSKGEGIIICCTVTFTTPATNTGFIAQGSSTTDTGLRVGFTNTNLLKPSFYSSTEQIYFPDTAVTPGVPTRILMYFGGTGQTLKFACFMNESSNQAAISSTTTTGNISPAGRVEPLFLGMYKVSANNYTSVTSAFQSLHIIKVQDINTVTFDKLKDLAIRYKFSPNSVFLEGETP